MTLHPPPEVRGDRPYIHLHSSTIFLILFIFIKL
jgi:hypothetical protein